MNNARSSTWVAR